MIQKASRKINVLSRKILFMIVGKRRIIMNAFFNSQFNNFPLVWMLSINNY